MSASSFEGVWQVMLSMYSGLYLGLCRLMRMRVSFFGPTLRVLETRRVCEGWRRVQSLKETVAEILFSQISLE